MNGLINKQGITVKQLKELVKNLPEHDEEDTPYEVWMETGYCVSNLVKCIMQLNKGDLIFKL